VTIVKTREGRGAEGMSETDWVHLPDKLPVPTDDGACDHLVGVARPSLPLVATTGGNADLSRIPGVSSYLRIRVPADLTSHRWFRIGI
jgi:hypothetical protein